jgi:hypothetical protein
MGMTPITTADAEIVKCWPVPAYRGATERAESMVATLTRWESGGGARDVDGLFAKTVVVEEGERIQRHPNAFAFRFTHGGSEWLAVASRTETIVIRRERVTRVFLTTVH